MYIKRSIKASKERTETTLTPPPRSPGAAPAHTPASGDGRGHPPDGTSSDKSSETAAGVSRAPSTALSRKESYKAQRQHYRREKKRAASALLHSIEDPTVVVLADWLKVRGSLKSWTKLWCVLKPVKQIDTSTRSSPIPVVINDNIPNRCSSADPKTKKSKISKWAQFIESIEILAKEHDSSDSQTPESDKKDAGFLDFLKKKEISERNLSEFKHKGLSKSLASSPMKIDIPKKTPILKYFDLPKSALSLGDKRDKSNNIRSKTPLPKRRSSTPSTSKTRTAQKRISDLRESGAKTDSENDDKSVPKKFKGSSEIICDTSDACNNILITKTAPSIERFRETSTSSTDDDDDKSDRRPPYRHNPSNGKFSLINYSHLPSTSFEALKSERRDDRFTSQSVYVTGKVLTDGEMFLSCFHCGNCIKTCF
ncbi:Oxysterol-binding protein-related protein 8 [Papilio machaon]|uniref:Oxysterol-binding protein-related protein 8 n=1 Tax=Papilio machaon TaxID=76193 RepID=A0A0N0PDU4_PAPMA|nr:Oxysterol-binding protein-related protein 8 [Papilio machaon]